MGGYGSGIWKSWGAKYPVERCLTLDLGYLRKNKLVYLGGFSSGTLTWSRNGEPIGSISYYFSGLILQLTYKKNGQDTETRVAITRTPAYFGGERLWFLCPICSRGEKLSKLYLPPNSKYFGCRKCHNLTYQSSQESRKYDGLYKLLARETGGSPQDIKKALKSFC